jgi:hypothetical protein
MYLATGGELTQKQDLDPNEEIEVYLYTVDELRQLLREGGIIQSMHMAALFYALQKLGYLTF